MGRSNETMRIFAARQALVTNGPPPAIMAPVAVSASPTKKICESTPSLRPK